MEIVMEEQGRVEVGLRGEGYEMCAVRIKILFQGVVYMPH